MQVRKLAAMLTLLAMVAALMPLTASVALGTTGGNNNPPDDDACYEEIHEDLYERPKFKTKYEYQKVRYEKFTQTRVRDFLWPKREWTEWSEYGPLTDWPGVGPLDWGVIPDPISGDHDGPEGNDPFKSGNYDDRRFEYQVVDTHTIWRFNDPGHPYTATGNTQQVPDGYESKWVPDGQVPDGDGWVFVRDGTRKGDRIPCEITDPTFDVTPESLVCNPQTGEIEGRGDGSITFHSFDNGSWDATNQTGLSAGFHGPFTAKADKHFIFASTGTDTFSTEVEVKAVADEETCDKLVTAVAPTQEQSQECEVEGTLSIPDTKGVQYLLDGDSIESGTHPGPISGTLTAKAKEGYELTNPDFSVEVNIKAAKECPEETTTTTESEPEDPFANIDYWCDVDGLNLYLSEGEWQIAGYLDGERLWDHTFSVTEVNELGYAGFGIALGGADEFVVHTDGLSKTYALDDCPIEPTEEPEEAEDETPSTLPFTGPSDHTGVLAGAGLLALIAGAGLTLLARKGEEDMA